MTQKRKPLKKTLVPDFERDIKESYIRERIPEVLDLLLKDQTTGRNILWCTGDYAGRGEGFQERDEIRADLISREDDKVIVPRCCKSADEQKRRATKKGEVFTPAWVCNAQNNLVDNAWFRRECAGFNEEAGKGWRTISKRIDFKGAKGTWKDYVTETRLEITCGEAPYLASRYDMANSADNNNVMPVEDRIGVLDRKLRVVSEHCRDEVEWIEWAKKAVKAVIGFDWQGDNVFIARENLLWTVLETCYVEFDKALISPKTVIDFARIISWNIWQMDGLKFVVPGTCKATPIVQSDKPKLEEGLFSFAMDEAPKPKARQMPLVEQCPGCAKKDPIAGAHLHNGVRCLVMDWDEERPIEFHTLVKDRRERHG